jgi:hypothetical protein
MVSRGAVVVISGASRIGSDASLRLIFNLA